MWVEDERRGNFEGELQELRKVTKKCDYIFKRLGTKDPGEEDDEKLKG